MKDFRTPGQKYYDNQRQFAIQFIDFNFNPPQCEIVSSVDNPLSGGGLTLTSETLNEYGTNLFYEPMPQEFMVTPATSPQVLVEIDGVSAACATLNCDYQYFEASAIITSMTLAKDGLELTITGTGFDDS